MKKWLSVLLAVAMLLSLLPAGAVEFSFPAAAEEESAALLWEYDTYGDGVVLTAYLGDAADVYVPATLTVDGATLPVLKLGDGLFQDNDTVNSVTLGEGIRRSATVRFTMRMPWCACCLPKA